MKRAFVLLTVLACGSKSKPADTIPLDAATPLQIVVLDDYSARESCEGVAPRKIEVSFDGRAAGVIEVPCRTKTVMPPPQFPGVTVTLPAGTHTVVARELGVGYSVERTIELPVILSSLEDGTDQLATKLPVLASDDQMEVTTPRVKISFDVPAPE